MCINHDNNPFNTAEMSNTHLFSGNGQRQGSQVYNLFLFLTGNLKRILCIYDATFGSLKGI